MPYRPNLKRPRAFTLIELLVAVAIIALLLAILLPTLSQARNMSRRSVCAANLQGQGRVLAMYESENNRYPINPRESIPGGWSPPPYGGEWSRAWSNQPSNVYSRGDLKFDLRRNFGDASYSNQAIGGSGKLWVCPGPSPIVNAIYAIADSPTPGAGLGAGNWYYTNYIWLWAEPGNRLNSSGALVTADSKWTRVISGSGTYAGPAGPKSSKDDITAALVTDFIAYEVGGSAPLAYTNHARTGGGGYSGGPFGSTHYLTDMSVAPATQYPSFTVGANILFNDKHVEFVRTSDLTPVEYAGVVQKSTATATGFLMSLTESQR